MLNARHLRRVLLALVFQGLCPMIAHADEGMWLLNNPPTATLKERYQFDLTPQWIDRAMKASVRFNSGGSGGFVSPTGLVVTNHHIAADALQKLSTPGRDLYREGFLARTLAEELPCPDLELNVLQSIEDVTAKVQAAVPADLPAAQAAAARRKVLASIETESLKATGLRSDVVTLYQGGLYHLYRYKKYTDVRLVFAPEYAIAGFGGDVDNFEYPRHGLDVAFFRAYENKRPVAVEHYFRWNATGPAENDLVIVTGHPGTTNRLETLAKLKHRRDFTLPFTLARLRSFEAALVQFSEQGIEETRMAGTDLHRVANGRKAFSGQLQGLLDPKILAQKAEAEQELQALAAPLRRPIEPATSAPWETIAKAQVAYRAIEKEHALLETGAAFFSDLFPIARHCVRMADELPKPSAERLREYSDSKLDSLKFQLFSPAPIELTLERVKLQTSLTFLAETLGGEHPLVVKVLAGKNPAARAEELTAGCQLFDVATRKALVAGGRAAIEASTDPMIQLAKTIDADARKLRKQYEDEIEEPQQQAYGKIATIRFDALGTGVAPDATFTLRLAFGTVRGYEVGGEKLPFHTTFASAFAKADAQGNRDPFALPARWMESKAKLDLSTPFNFVSTADTIGGNSGSPVLNRAGELVGINFDRNRHGLVRNFVYTEVQARHISVHCRAVLEALGTVYGAKELLAELRP